MKQMPTAPDKFIHNWIMLYHSHLIKPKKQKNYLFQTSMREEAKSKLLDEYITSLDQADRHCLFILVEAVVYIASASGIAPACIASASVSPAFLVSIKILRVFLKTIRKKRQKHKKIVTLANVNVMS